MSDLSDSLLGDSRQHSAHKQQRFQRLPSASLNPMWSLDRGSGHAARQRAERKQASLLGIGS
jgi:hypothetical protein